MRLFHVKRRALPRMQIRGRMCGSNFPIGVGHGNTYVLALFLFGKSMPPIFTVKLEVPTVLDDF